MEEIHTRVTVEAEEEGVIIIRDIILDHTLFYTTDAYLLPHTKPIYTEV